MTHLPIYSVGAEVDGEVGLKHAKGKKLSEFLKEGVWTWHGAEGKTIENPPTLTAGVGVPSEYQTLSWVFSIEHSGPS